MGGSGMPKTPRPPRPPGERRRVAVPPPVWSIMQVNPQIWDGLTEEEREAVMNGARRVHGDGAGEFIETAALGGPRLEATRRPEPRAVLAKRIGEDGDANIGHHAASGLPGDSTSVVLLYLALNCLIVERLTVSDIFTEQEIHELVDVAVRRMLGDDRPPPSTGTGGIGKRWRSAGGSRRSAAPPHRTPGARVRGPAVVAGPLVGLRAHLA